MPETKITVGIPVYRGEALVADALTSILKQSDPDFRVLISVDNNDKASAEICRAFAGDPRFTMVVQPNRLGWAGGINWLIAACETEYFHYMGQDDRLDPHYHARLGDYLDRNPLAATVAPDIQWFGDRSDIQTNPSLVGEAFSRVCQHLESCRGFALLGMSRTAALRKAPPLTTDRHESAMEDLVWTARMACLGELHRYAEPLYLKRAHHAAEGRRFLRSDQPRIRDAWVDACARFFVAALPAAKDRTEALELFRLVLRQSLSTESGYEYFYPVAVLSTSERRALTEAVAASIESEPQFSLHRSFGPEWPELRAASIDLASRKPWHHGARAWLRQPRKMARRWWS